LRPPMTVPVYPEVLERYVGQYRYDKKSGGLEVRRDGERLVAQWIGPSMRFAPYEVFPCSETVFRNEFWGVQAEFFPNSGYKTDSVVLSSIGPYSGLQKPIKLTQFSTKVSESPPFVRPSSKVYENDAGQYRKTLLFGLIRIGPTLSISHQKDEVGDHLTASARGFGSAEVFPISESTFILSPDSGNELRLTFLRSRKNQTKGVLVYWNGKKIHGTRVSKEPAKERPAGHKEMGDQVRFLPLPLHQRWPRKSWKLQ